MLNGTVIFGLMLVVLILVAAVGLAWMIRSRLSQAAPLIFLIRDRHRCDQAITSAVHRVICRPDFCAVQN